MSKTSLVASIVKELAKELDRLIAEGEALQRGLAINTGEITLDDFRAQVVDALTQHAGSAKGASKPKKPTKKQVDAIMETWVISFREHYQAWYSEALAVVGQVLPDRLTDFRELYKVDRRKEIDPETFGLADYQIGLSVSRAGVTLFDPDTTAYSKFGQQLSLLKAARRVLDSRLADIRGVLQADLFDSELDAALELLSNGFVRAGGMIAGVVLERHLAEVARTHQVAVRNKVPTISHYNDALKNAGVIDVPTWRFIQRLGDIRNLCGHPKEREPTADEVRDLVEGADKIAKTVS